MAISAYDLLLVNKMVNSDKKEIILREISVEQNVNLGNYETFRLRMLFTVPEGINEGKAVKLARVKLVEQLHENKNVDIKVTEKPALSPEKKIVSANKPVSAKSPPPIDWDDRAINEKAATYNCKKCGNMMVAQHGVSKNDKPYLVIKCPDKNCKSSFFLTAVNFMKNMEEILKFRPDWKPKDLWKQVAASDPVKLSVDEVATIADKTPAEIKALVATKRKKLMNIITHEAALKIVAKDLGVIKT